LGHVVDDDGRPENDRLRLRAEVDQVELGAAPDEMATRDLPPPVVAEEAVRGLKFAEVLPPDLAAQTLAERLGAKAAAHHVSNGSVWW
jgi:hypothetical protein